MNDRETTVEELRGLVRQFVDERNWQQFHSPKNLSMAMAIEVAELMEHFQWIDNDGSWEHHRHQPQRQAIQEELADVMCYVLAFANSTGIDLSAAIVEKVNKNREKYPAEKYYGKY